MIDNYHIDLEKGYEHQVGLYIRGEEQTVQQFYEALREAGFKYIQGKKTPDRPEFNHFAYVSLHNKPLDKPSTAKKLSSLCEQYCPSKPESKIDNYHIDPEQGYKYQVGLYVQGEEQAVQRLYEALQEAEYKCVRSRTPPDRSGFNHLAYVSITNDQLDKPSIAEKLSHFCEQYCSAHPSTPEPPPPIIDNYHIDPRWGYDNQVGLYVQGEEQTVRQFYWALQQAGFQCFPGSKPPDRPEFSHFAYVSIRDEALNEQENAKKLSNFCKKHCPSYPPPPPLYKTWRASFDASINDYKTKNFTQSPGLSGDTFDKTHVYNLIASAHYDEAEEYLQRFTDEVPPALVPIYLVYLYHEWQRPTDIIITHNRYEDLFRASDPDYHVVAWIAEAYLAQKQPDRALVVLDEFLPEFHRQGVAEKLLTLRASIRKPKSPT